MNLPLFVNFKYSYNIHANLQWILNYVQNKQQKGVNPSGPLLHGVLW